MLEPNHYLKAVLLSATLLAAGIAPAADSPVPVRLSEPVAQTEESETFGSPLDESVPGVSLRQLVEDSDSYLGKPVKVAVRVAQVCQKKGCFFVAQEGDTSMRVSFKDYGFFVPTDISGRRVVMVGELVARELTAEQAEHFAEDLGESYKAARPGKVWELVATSVRIPRG